MGDIFKELGGGSQVPDLGNPERNLNPRNTYSLLEFCDLWDSRPEGQEDLVSQICCEWAPALQEKASFRLSNPR